MSDQQAHIGRFEITAELGRGSMGIVHRAYDPVMGRDVAIKTVLLPYGIPLQKKEEFHERFRREARAAGRLSHPGIVTVYDFNDGAPAGNPFIAMEYVEGQTLDELIRDGEPVSPGWALTVGETLADALQTAHAAGIVHRDLKPANILVRASDDVAKISDFGVARVGHSELTALGATYGSPAYMAPERLRGAPADARSDLFALAVILYELLCRRRPFGGDDFATTCAAILTMPTTPIRSHVPDLAPAFDRFFARALAKDPDERYQSGAAFRDAVRALREEQESHRGGQATAGTAAPAGPPRRGLVLVLGVGAFLLLCGALALRSVLLPSSPAPPAVGSSPVVAEAGEAEGSAVSALEPARVAVRITSRVRSGTLALLLDGQQVYATALATGPAPAGRPWKRLVGRERQEIAAELAVAPGPHTLLARLTLSEDARKFEQSVELDLGAGDRQGLAIAVGRKAFGPRVALSLD